MNKYETLFIVKPDLAESEVDAVLDRLQDRIGKSQGKVAAIDYWGHRYLAYPIQYRGEQMARGFYVLLTYLGTGETVDEVERNIKIMDPVFRFLTVKQQDQVDPESVIEVSITRRQEKPAPALPEPPGFAEETKPPEAPGEEVPAETAAGEEPGPEPAEESREEKLAEESREEKPAEETSDEEKAEEATGSDQEPGPESED